MAEIVGYRTLDKKDLVAIEAVKQMEERCLRMGDNLKNMGADARSVAIFVTEVQTAFMWLVRSIAQPTRIPLPDDDESLFKDNAA